MPHITCPVPLARSVRAANQESRGPGLVALSDHQRPSPGGLLHVGKGIVEVDVVGDYPLSRSEFAVRQLELPAHAAVGMVGVVDEYPATTSRLLEQTRQQPS